MQQAVAGKPLARPCLGVIYQQVTLALQQAREPAHRLRRLAVDVGVTTAPARRRAAERCDRRRQPGRQGRPQGRRHHHRHRRPARRRGQQPRRCADHPPARHDRDDHRAAGGEEPRPPADARHEAGRAPVARRRGAGGRGVSRRGARRPTAADLHPGVGQVAVERHLQLADADHDLADARERPQQLVGDGPRRSPRGGGSWWPRRAPGRSRTRRRSRPSAPGRPPRPPAGGRVTSSTSTSNGCGVARSSGVTPWRPWKRMPGEDDPVAHGWAASSSSSRRFRARWHRPSGRRGGWPAHHAPARCPTPGRDAERRGGQRPFQALLRRAGPGRGRWSTCGSCRAGSAGPAPAGRPGRAAAAGCGRRSSRSRCRGRR